MEFIDEQKIQALLDDNSINDKYLQKAILDKSRDAKGLSLSESAALLKIDSEDLLDELFQTAKDIKEKIYGNRLVLFAPLYVTNVCVNNCMYCAFRRDNRDLTRKSLSLDEIESEAEYLVGQGHKRVLLVAGEHPEKSALSFIGQAVERIYNVDHNGNNIRRININTAPLSIEDFKILKSFGIGTFQCFQETYHYSTYKKMHPDGPKADYSWRIYAMDRALQAGIDDVGIGALFGLAEYRFEALAMLQHAFYLDQKYGIGPHTISVPRIEPALNAPAAANPPNAVDNKSFKKMVAVLRLAVPYTGIILSTRESQEIRRELFEVGISQISAGSRTSPGAYKHNNDEEKDQMMSQFQLGDHRSLQEVVADCCELGYMPSFCTACYRSERTGDRFMELAKSGNIGKICVPNAFITFKEYLNDFASNDTFIKGVDFIQKELAKEQETTQRKIKIMIDRIDSGERDIYL